MRASCHFVKSLSPICDEHTKPHNRYFLDGPDGPEFCRRDRDCKAYRARYARRTGRIFAVFVGNFVLDPDDPSNLVRAFVASPDQIIRTAWRRSYFGSDFVVLCNG